MYYLHTRNDMVRIPPDRLDEDINKVTMELAHQAFEGRMGPDQKLVVLITNLELTGDSRVVHGDGAVYQPCLLYTSPSPRDGLLSRMPSSA